MSRFLSSEFSEIKPYTPGEQPQNVKYIKLNTNESPYPPSPNVVKAITEKECENLRLYSDPTVKTLVDEIATFYNVDAKNVIVGNGSDEILAFSFLAFGGNKEFAYPDITYGFYPVYAKLFGIKSNVIPLTNSFDVDENDYLKANQNVIIANPNAPTGKIISHTQIEKILKAHPNDIVIIDEAYVDFGGETCVSLINKYDNLLVVQTFSKSRNLAGARIGFGIANSEIIADLNKMKFSFNPYNINRLSIIAGTQSMKDFSYFKECTNKIIATRDNTVNSLKELGFDVLDSKANFIFIKNNKIKGEVFYNKLRENGILVRWFNIDRIKDYVRVTIGSKEEMEEFINKTKQIIEV